MLGGAVGAVGCRGVLWLCRGVQWGAMGCSRACNGCSGALWGVRQGWQWVLWVQWGAAELAIGCCGVQGRAVGCHGVPWGAAGGRNGVLWVAMGCSGWALWGAMGRYGVLWVAMGLRGARGDTWGRVRGLPGCLGPRKGRGLCQGITPGSANRLRGSLWWHRPLCKQGRPRRPMSCRESRCMQMSAGSRREPAANQEAAEGMGGLLYVNQV